jgi:2-hydroxychromene-2-carboxylate isomerase
MVWLLEAEQADDSLLSAARTMTDLWGKNGHNESDTEFSEHHQQTLSENEQKLRRLGHYQGSMTYHLGEWFWGVDRLDHLERSLIDQGLSRETSVDITFTQTWAGVGSTPVGLPEGLEDHPASDTPLEVFFSIRSPYSYLGLERAITLARNWNVPLRLRPVLPMLMRGQSVPDAKKWYIFHDTKREALKLGISYGFVADPLGPGVERCYALFEYARSLGREIEYMRSYARAVNAEGIRSETDEGLRIIVERAGLDWQKAKSLLTDQSWRSWAEGNRKAMYDCGLWGVPSFRYGAVSCWGQDRLWLIADEVKIGHRVSAESPCEVG